MKRLLLLALCASQIHTMDHSELNRELISRVIHLDIIGVHDLLERGAQVNAPDESGRTALSHAAGLGSSELVCEMLLEYGADPEMADKSNMRPFDYAQERMHVLFDMYNAQHPEEDRVLFVRRRTGSYRLLNDPKAIQKVILNGDNPRMKRLKKDTSNICEALFEREIGLK